MALQHRRLPSESKLPWETQICLASTKHTLSYYTATCTVCILEHYPYCIDTWYIFTILTTILGFIIMFHFLWVMSCVTCSHFNSQLLFQGCWEIYSIKAKFLKLAMQKDIKQGCTGVSWYQHPEICGNHLFHSWVMRVNAVQGVGLQCQLALPYALCISSWH
jgi:hypothetical protein